VRVGVLVGVLDRINGVGLRVGVDVIVIVSVTVTVGVRFVAFGASAIAIQPMQ